MQIDVQEFVRRKMRALNRFEEAMARQMMFDPSLSPNRTEEEWEELLQKAIQFQPTRRAT